MKSTVDSIFQVAFGTELDSMCGSSQEGKINAFETKLPSTTNGAALKSSLVSSYSLHQNLLPPLQVLYIYFDCSQIPPP